MRGTDTWTLEPMSARPDLERLERERISHKASESLFHMYHDDLAELLVPNGAGDWLLADLTVTELRAAFRRKAVRQSAELRVGLLAWGTAAQTFRIRREIGIERVVDEFRAVADPLTDCIVQSLVERTWSNPVPSRTELHDIIDHAVALQAVGERYGERGRRAAVRASWDYVSVSEFEAGLTDALSLIEHFTVDGEPVTELLEAGLPGWAHPLIKPKACRDMDNPSSRIG